MSRPADPYTADTHPAYTHTADPRPSDRRPSNTIRSGRSRVPRTPQFAQRIAVAFLLVLAAGGGAGVRYPLVALAAQGLALVLIVLAVRRASASSRLVPGSDGPAPKGSTTLSRLLLVFAAALLLLVLQLVPLPPAWWSRLPGRETGVQIYALLGWSARWHAFSLTPDATLAAALALLVPVAAMMTMASLSLPNRIVALRCVVIAALTGTVLGVLQVAAGASSAPMLYESAHRGFGVGLFVNRNHQATLLLVAIVFAAVPGVMGPDMVKTGVMRMGVAGTRQAQRLASIATTIVLALGIVATSSRTAFALLPLALIVALALIVGVRRTARPLLVAAALYLLGGLLLVRTDPVQRLFARFATLSEELRYQYWDTTLFAIRQSFPFGTGFGSFERVYRTVEPLGQVTPLSVNHAHDEYLEVILEGGLPAVILMLAGLAVLAAALISGWRQGRDRQERATLVAAGAATGLILLVSLVDYPLRMAGIAGLFGAALGLIAAIGRPEPVAAPASPRNILARPHAWIIAVAAIPVALVASGDALGRYLVQHRYVAAATMIAPWSAAAWSAAADDDQAANKLAAARIAAARALGIVPIDAAAARAHGYADIQLGAHDRGTHLLQRAAALGWRDTLLQLWLADRALKAGNASIAAERIDAVLRRARLSTAMMAMMRATYLTPGGVDAIATRLADHPPWRQGFFNAIADDAARSVPRTLDFLAVLRRAGVGATPDETMLMRWRLADRGGYGDARRIWRASGGRGLIADGDFETLPARLPGGLVPYAWGAPGLPGVRVVVTDRGAGDSGHAVDIVTDGLADGMALAQIVALPPGRWRVSAMVRGGDVPGELTLSCTSFDQSLDRGFDRRLDRPPGEVIIPLAGTSGGVWRRVEGVVAIGPGCPAQHLGIRLREHDGQTSTVRIDAVQVSLA